MTFRKRLKHLREEKEVNQKEIGKFIGVSSRMISFYENGVHIPRDAESIIKLAQYFNVSIDYIFGVSNIRNYKELSKLNQAYESLPEEGQHEALEYITYLKMKYKVK